MSDDERMRPAELVTIREFLGLTRKALGTALEVREDTVRKWELGKDPIPYRVADEITKMEEYTARAVGAVVDGLKDSRDPAVAVYRFDADMPAHKAEAWCTARWWRHVVARAAIEIPGVEIDWDGEATTDE